MRFVNADIALRLSCTLQEVDGNLTSLCSNSGSPEPLDNPTVTSPRGFPLSAAPG